MDYQELECGEANGFPGHMWYDPVHCNGKFIRHHTFVKDRVKATTADSVMQSLVDIMKLNFEKIKSTGPVVLSEEDEKNTEPEQQEGEEENEEEWKKGRKRKEERVYHEPLRRK
jgi:phosphotransferase system IIA component